MATQPDSTVLDEVVAAVEPPDAAAAAAARARLAGLEGLDQLAAQLAGIKRTLLPPVDRKVVIACAADYQGHGAAAAVRAVLGGRTALPVLARGAGARLMVVDSGVRDAESGIDGVVPLRVGNGTGAPGDAMTAEQAIMAVQTGIALVLSLASEGVDVLAVADIAPDAPAAASRLRDHQGDGPLQALARDGGFEIGAIAGICVAAAAIRLPIVVAGAGATEGAALAVRLAAPVAGYLVPASALSPLAERADGAGAPLMFPLIDASARLLRELGPT